MWGSPLDRVVVIVRSVVMTSPSMVTGPSTWTPFGAIFLYIASGVGVHVEDRFFGHVTVDLVAGTWIMFIVWSTWLPAARSRAKNPSVFSAWRISSAIVSMVSP